MFRTTKNDNDSFLLNQALSTTFDGTFSTISDPTSFYSWVGASIQTAYSNGGVISGYHRVLGPIRLRQVRLSANDSCRILAGVSNEFSTCYPEYSASVVSEASYNGFDYTSTNTISWWGWYGEIFDRYVSPSSLIFCC